MTAKQAENLGFDIIDKMGWVWHGATESKFRLNKPLRKITIPEFITYFFNTGHDWGRRYGKLEKIDEIKRALNIEPTSLD